MPAVADLSTPALVVDGGALAHNLDAMTAALPGSRLRPHVKAHKCTALAREQLARGHTGFTCATPREVVGMVQAGFDDLLLANECVDVERLRAMAECDASVIVAVDSEATITAAASAGITDVLIDVNIGLRCGCRPEEAGGLADRARAAGLTVRGVMGYASHVQLTADREVRATNNARALERLAPAIAAVGGDIVSGGGTGSYDLDTLLTETQAGSYALMDTAYDALGLPFLPGLRVVASIVHVDRDYVVADCGLKALGMDHGLPTVEAHSDTIYCSDEHVTFVANRTLRVGDRVLVRPAHVDPTIAYHERMYITDGAGIDAPIIDTWAIDLRGWDIPK